MGKLNRSVIQQKVKNQETLDTSLVTIRRLREVTIRSVVVQPKNNRSETMDSYVRKVDVLELDGNISEKWRVFKQNFDIFATAIELSKKAEAVQVAIFLNAVGPDAVDTFNSFDLNDIERAKYNSVVKAFSDFCVPKKNEVYESYVFHSRNQQENEPFDNFLMDLKKQIKKCEFGAPPLPDRMLRDRIVMGVSDKKLQKRLLETDKLDVTKTIDMARAAEVTLKQMQDIRKSNEMTSTTTTNTIASADALSHHRDKDKYNNSSGSYNNKFNGKSGNNDSESAKFNKNFPLNRSNQGQVSGKCHGCNYAHPIGKCPAYGKHCNNCGKMNHFAMACMQKRIRELKVESPQPDDRDDDTEQFTVDSLSSKLHVSRPKKNGRWYQVIRLGDYYVRCKLDSGADVNTLPYKYFKNMKAVKLMPYKRQSVKSYTGERMEIMGTIEVVVMCNNEIVVDEFLVIDLDEEPLLSLDLCVALKLIERKKVSEVKLDDAERFLTEHKDVFEGFGGFVNDFNMELKEGAVGVIRNARRIPESLSGRLKSTLEELCKRNIVAKVNEPTDFVSNLVIVEKKDGSLRLCLDPQELNKSLKEENHPLPTFDVLFSKLNGKKYFTVIDLKDGFWQVRLNERTSKLCTFSTPFGCYRFLVLPFGVKIAPEVFQKYLERSFEDIEGVHVNIDDLLIYAESLQKHDEILGKVMAKARELNIKFNKKKLQYRTHSVKYVGHIVSDEGIACDPERILAVQKIESPKNKKGLEKMLGFINYVRDYVPNLAEISQPLRELLKKDVVFQWLPIHTECLSIIKTKIAQATVLMTFDAKKEITIETDASKFGLGCCLMQDGRPISYASRSLSQAEIRYAQIEKELLAIVFACHKFHYFIYGRKVTVRSDHEPLVSVMRKDFHSIPSARLQRMKLRLTKYVLDVTYVPGKYLYVADLLSRYFDKDICESEIKDIDEVVHSLNISDSRIIEFQKETDKDPIMKELKVMLRDGWPKSKSRVTEELRFYYKLRHDLFIEDDLIFLNSRVLVPKSLQKLVLQLLHKSHLGIEKTKLRARSVVYWPRLNEDIELMVSRCGTCQRFRSSNIKQPMLSHSVPDLPYQKIGMDIAEFEGKNYLVSSDFYSRYLEIHPLRGKGAAEVIRSITGSFSHQGIPKEVVADNVPFNSFEFRNFCKTNDITLTTSSPTYAQSNGFAEKFVGIAKSLLKKCKDSNTELWLALLEYRNTPLVEIGASPAEMLLSRKTRTLLPEKRVLFNPSIVPNVKNNIELKNKKKKFYYDRHAKFRQDFTVGQDIWFQHSKRGWLEAVIAQKDSAPRSYWVQLKDGTVLRRNANVLRKRN